MGLFGGNDVTLHVEGMTCGHCQMHVVKALEGLDGVKKAKVDLGKKEAVITLEKNADVPVQKMIAAVKEAGYEATS